MTDCHCAACVPHSVSMRMIVCHDCGCKRCPHAADHTNDCTGTTGFHVSGGHTCSGCTEASARLDAMARAASGAGERTP